MVEKRSFPALNLSGIAVKMEVLNLLEIRKLLLVGEEHAEYFLLSKSGFDEEFEKLSTARDYIHLIT